MGAPGSTAALALLIDAVKKGGAMASGNVGGLSGTFIPVSEDEGMIRAVRSGALSLDKLEAFAAPTAQVEMSKGVLDPKTLAEVSKTILDQRAALTDEAYCERMVAYGRELEAPSREVWEGEYIGEE